ncbi:methyltransferase family protein [Clostridium paridis]|uniref:Isoprenylcysteine carboxylmethyltransferase family protein n=1 Tax=Clostridium paridis TaxID=2803863 RepID=A0A937FJM5_9CLOT|nr:isoprenylcysteine carboxylmethyltransferase family protein [Clostridium paridis]MBL4933722.1 isoprenylcysteine carboxylmethyltransferase family protein [Clostridium paridis]
MNNCINLISILLLFAFGIAYLLKLYALSKRYNLKANVLANRNKSKKTQLVERMLQLSTLVWIVVWFGEVISNQLRINDLLKLWNNNLVSIVGLLVITAGIIFFCVAAITMKNSWRVGIDKSTKSELITEGIYKYSRNPAFVGFYLMFIGLFFVYLDIITLIVMILNIYIMNRLVIEEEKHLEEMFGEEYIKYKDKTPRYLLW